MLEERIYSLNQYLRETFGEKIYRLSLDPGTTCPNRDGTLSFGGCAFCSEGGSGEFSPDAKMPLDLQIDEAIRRVAAKGAKHYLGYFQAFTGTYGDLAELSKHYEAVLQREEIVGLSIGTRPDCLAAPVLDCLKKLRTKYQKPIWLELGLQTANDEVARALNRGYNYDVFVDAVNRLAADGFPVIVHLILGLPGETTEDMLATVTKVCTLPIQGLKLSLLHILRGTGLEAHYSEHPEAYLLMTKEAYLEALRKVIEHIPKNIVLHRITGDGPKNILIAPAFSANKRDVLNSITRYLTEHDSYQGKALITR